MRWLSTFRVGARFRLQTRIVDTQPCSRAYSVPMTSTVLQLTAVLEPRGPAAAIVLTDAQVASLGSTKTPPVRFTIGGQTVAGRIGRMGGENLLGLNKSVRTTLGVEAGDTVDVTIELDAEPRTVELPAEPRHCTRRRTCGARSIRRTVSVEEKRARTIGRRRQARRHP